MSAPVPAPDSAAPGRGRRVVVVPGSPALLARYACEVDPVADLRRACLDAVAWLGERVRVVADDAQGHAVAEELLGRAPVAGDAPGAEDADVLVVANGSACRSEKAPGHLDPRAADFDARVQALLGAGDLAGLAALLETEGTTAAELLTCGLSGLALLHEQGMVVTDVHIDHADDPFGVMYWVVRFTCGS